MRNSVDDNDDARVHPRNGAFSVFRPMIYAATVPHANSGFRRPRRGNPPRATNGNVIGKSQLFPCSRSAADAAGMRNHREDAPPLPLLRPSIRDGSRSTNVLASSPAARPRRSRSAEFIVKKSPRESRRPSSVKVSRGVPRRGRCGCKWIAATGRRCASSAPVRRGKGGGRGTRPARGALRALITIHLAERTEHFSGSTAGQFR